MGKLLDMGRGRDGAAKTGATLLYGRRRRRLPSGLERDFAALGEGYRRGRKLIWEPEAGMTEASGPIRVLLVDWADEFDQLIVEAPRGPSTGTHQAYTDELRIDDETWASGDLASWRFSKENPGWTVDVVIDQLDPETEGRLVDVRVDEPGHDWHGEEHVARLTELEPRSES